MPRSVGPPATSATEQPVPVDAERWNARERELLRVTLSVVQEVGYDRMTVDEVAARARASKTTMYRRWPSKAELVLAAFIDGVRQVAVQPHTGSLRTDLLALARVIAEQVGQHATTIIGVLPEMRRNPALHAAMQREFVDQRQQLMQAVLQAAVDRGEIEPASSSDDIWDLMPGYLVFRGLISGRPITDETIRALVDDVLMPTLARRGAPDC